jgi:UDP-N-acetyl-2-amino-2-deoxyglucuronate dehydrogenase
LKNFAIIGAAGYVAPRHMKAIKETNGNLLAALDPSDSVGIIDSYFPETAFFTELERFDRYIEKLRLGPPDKQLNYLSVCSPNYLHDSHIRLGLRAGLDVICEKPIVLNPWNIDALKKIESETGKAIYTILQLRLHPSILVLREKIRKEGIDKKHDVDVTYITSRGRWYMQSWKGDIEKSGGIASNIGIHLFDMLHFIFDDLQENVVHLNETNKASGYLEFQNARVRWFLSTDNNDLPLEVQKAGHRTFRSIACDGIEIEFSGGFADLHTKSYENILRGDGFSLEINRAVIETVAAIRTAQPVEIRGEVHPFTRTL